ncbi:MAG: ABC transporter ATP-binding protein [Oscillospiraceae bacterium]|nr:ABC transporter ATP-binding protein [Oscillospiraceae bacterium]
MAQLICQDLTIGYEGKTVVSGLSFTVNAGDYLCILGENGSGKSTLMKTILRLKSPMSGRIENGDGLIPNEIGYLPQQTVVQKDFPASVREVVTSGCLNGCGFRPFYNKKEKRLAEENMEKLGITDLANRCYRELSGGQQQRALLARALCATRKILLLDEPTAGLDPNATLEMYDLIAELNKSGTSIIMISHDLSNSAKHASHILHIGKQSILFYGEMSDYLKSDTGRKFSDFMGGESE